MTDTFFTRYIMDDRPVDGHTVAWGSVIAGVVTYIALLILFSLIGAAIGLGGLNLQSAHPADGIGMGLILWTIFSIVVSFIAAGYVAGVTAQRAGFIHGFLVWAVSLLTILVLTTSAVSSAFGAVGHLLGMTGSAIGSTVSTVGDAVGTLSQEAFDSISNNLNVDFDSADVSDQVVTALEKSDIPELQPNYLQAQLDAVIDEVKQAGKDILVDGQDPETVYNRVIKDIQDRANNIYDNIDEADLRRAIVENTDLTPQEADDAIQNVEEAYATASKKAKETLNEAEKELEKLQQEAKQQLEEAKAVANDVTDASAKYSLYAFGGLLVAALASSFAGFAGSKAAREHQIVVE